MQFELGICELSEYDADGFLGGIKIDALGNKGMSLYEAFSPYGFIGRPADAAGDSGAKTLFATQGRHGFAWALTDGRAISKIPLVQKGGSAQYASDGQFFAMDPTTHVGTHYVPYEFDANGTPTKAHVITVGVDGNGKPIVELSSGTGLSVTLLDRVITISNVAGDAWIQVDDDGIKLLGAIKAFGGVELGGTAAALLAKAAELIAWATNVNVALNGLGAPIAPLAPTVATTLTKGA